MAFLDTPKAPETNVDGDFSPLFYEQFPDGVVPIRYGIGDSALGKPLFTAERMAEVASIFCDEYERTMALFDAVHDLGLDADYLDHLRTRYHQSEPGTAYPERGNVIALLMQGGMTLEQIARYLEIDEDDVVDTLFMGKGTRDTTLVLYADLVLADEPTYPLAKLARELHCDRDILRRLRAARQLGSAGSLRKCGTRSHDGVLTASSTGEAA